MTAAPTIRPARPSDYDAFTRLFPELATGDTTPDAGRFAREVAPTTLVAELEGGEIVGYVWYAVLAGLGAIRHLVVAPGARRSGLGRQLMTAAAAPIRASGAERWGLFVKPENTAAINLYRALGMEKGYTSHAMKIAWDALLAARAEAGADDVSVRPFASDEDAALEARFRVDAGQLGDARRLGGRIFLVAERGGTPVGLAAFDREFPGVRPLRAEDVGVALELLGGLHAHRRPEHDVVHFVVDDQPELARALGAKGAALKLEVWHMEGPLR